MKKYITLASLAAGLTFFTPITDAQAQALNCVTPSSQAEMTGCASQAYEDADAALNAQWKRSMRYARAEDSSDVPAGLPSRADLLRDAQRKWIPYRDATCSVESTAAYGGTLQNQIYFECLERLTKLRTVDLRRFGTIN